MKNLCFIICWAQYLF